MTGNPALAELGFSADDRVVIIHADDVGMCEATIEAFFELAESGMISAGSVMVPCPWFPAVAAGCRDCIELDVGVHLTLTSEWDGYRWGPISTRDPASGLLDEDGYFYRNQDQWRSVDQAAVHREVEAQVDRALAAGLDVTHIDHHMFAMLRPCLADQYVSLGFNRQVPVLMTRQPQWVAALSEQAIAGWEQQGLPVFDHLREMPLDEPPANRLDLTRTLFDELPPGLTYLITHPARDTPELRAIAPDWRARVADFNTFRDGGLAHHLRRNGIQIIGWRPVRELMRTRRNRHLTKGQT
ncbi:MAG TPA: polysaccharide deacetylase family protein [Pseudonocardiaceae bacterium]|nr:polysaccharide deacetylase family protein [Pseudonocardiaceae bacterium]